MKSHDFPETVLVLGQAQKGEWFFCDTQTPIEQ